MNANVFLLLQCLFYNFAGVMGIGTTNFVTGNVLVFSRDSDTLARSSIQCIAAWHQRIGTYFTEGVANHASTVRWSLILRRNCLTLGYLVEATGFSKLFQGIRPYTLTLKLLHYMPFYREYIGYEILRPVKFSQVGIGHHVHHCFWLQRSWGMWCQQREYRPYFWDKRKRSGHTDRRCERIFG